ncbi:MAG: hypothetical protein CM15mP84_04410 [Cellvibrionales bacterium]|nr:MAG: hypothetical protein CM15mP84_04410 [Cellvibrionales bacterium]
MALGTLDGLPASLEFRTVFPASLTLLCKNRLELMQIPTISFASGEMERRANLEAALEDLGFMSLSDTGIEAAQVSAVFEASRSFFQCSDKFKQRFRYRSARDNFGYQSLGMESLDPDRPPDLKETLTVRNPRAQRRTLALSRAP